MAVHICVLIHVYVKLPSDETTSTSSSCAVCFSDGRQQTPLTTDECQQSGSCANRPARHKDISICLIKGHRSLLSWASKSGPSRVLTAMFYDEPRPKPPLYDRRRGSSGPEGRKSRRICLVFPIIMPSLVSWSRQGNIHWILQFPEVINSLITY